MFMYFKRARMALMSMVLLLLASAGTLRAHELVPAITDADVSADRLELRIVLAVEPLIAGLDLSAITDTNESARSDIHDDLRALTPDALSDELRAVWPQIAQGFNITSDGTRLEPELLTIAPDPVGNVEFPRESVLTLTAALPPGDAPVQVGWIAEYGAIVVRQVADGMEPYSVYLTGGEQSDPLPRTGAATQSGLSIFLDYIVIGFEHIVPKGLDHILFVLGLFFFSLHLRPLLFQVTAFTLAHTVTLALASLNIVSVPASIVEPLIAASIVYVAVENTMTRTYHQWRTAVVFGFGLLHGLGFASVLGDVGLEPTRFLTGLIGFNIGVEVGQLSVIAAAWLLLASWAGRKPWYRRVIATPASIGIALVGAYWFIERTLL